MFRMMKKVYAFCEGDVDSCPFRVFDFGIQQFLCNFHDEKASLIIEGNYNAIKLLVRRACYYVRHNLARLDMIREVSKERTLKMLKSIEVGDELFWINRSQVVTLLERPPELSQTVRVKCQLKSGKVEYAWANTLQKVSKGNFKGEYIIKGLDLERRTAQLKYKTQMYGFRVDIGELRDKNVLTIYGDSQEEVDEYINLVLEQGLELRFGPV